MHQKVKKFQIKSTRKAMKNTKNIVCDKNIYVLNAEIMTDTKKIFRCRIPVVKIDEARGINRYVPLKKNNVYNGNVIRFKCNSQKEIKLINSRVEIIKAGKIISGKIIKGSIQRKGVISPPADGLPLVDE